MTDLIATAPYTYAGKRLKAGDSFSASESDARLLTLVGKAKLPEVVPPKPKKAAAPKKQAAAAAPKGGYARRDMRARA